jgi:hypothetical protein
VAWSPLADKLRVASCARQSFMLQSSDELRMLILCLFKAHPL